MTNESSSTPSANIPPGEMSARKADIQEQMESRRQASIAAGREQRGETVQGKESLLGWVGRKLRGG